MLLTVNRLLYACEALPRTDKWLRLSAINWERFTIEIRGNIGASFRGLSNLSKPLRYPGQDLGKSGTGKRFRTDIYLPPAGTYPRPEHSEVQYSVYTFWSIRNAPERKGGAFDWSLREGIRRAHGTNVPLSLYRCPFAKISEEVTLAFTLAQ